MQSPTPAKSSWSHWRIVELGLKLNQRLNELGSPALAVVGLTLAAYLFYIGLKLAIGDFDVSRFITAGDMFTNASQLSTPIHILPHSAGYDGQFYYRLALDPFTRQELDHGIRLDNPPFRMQRIGYPLIVWLLSWGGTVAVPWLMVLVNLTAIGAIAFLGAKIVAQFQQSPAWALLLAFYPGLVVSLSRDLAECVALALTLAAIYSAQSRRHLLAGLLGIVAVLCRETTLLVLLGFGVMQLFEARTNTWKTNWLWYLLPPAAFLGWQGWLIHWWDQPPHSGGLQDLGVPLVGYFKLLWNALFQPGLFSPNPLADGLMRSYTLIAALGAGLTLILTLPRLARAPITLVIPWTAYAILMMCLSNVLWLSPGEFLRAFTETYALSILIAAATASTRAGKWLAIYWAIVMVPTLVVFLR